MGPLSNFLLFTVEATHLPISCPLLPLGCSCRQVNCLWAVRSGGYKADEQVWVGVRDEPVLCLCCGTGAIGVPTCSSNHLARLLGNAERSPVGTGRASETRLAQGRSCPREPLRLENGSIERGPLPWEAPSSGRPSGPGSRRRGLGRQETCLAVGRCDLSGGGGVGGSPVRPVAPPCSAAKERAATAGPHTPGNGGPGRGHSSQAPLRPSARAWPLRSQVGGAVVESSRGPAPGPA